MPTPELVAEFQRRYRLAGGSPLIRNTWAQALALERLLNSSPSSFPLSPSSPPHSLSSFPRRREPTYPPFHVSIGMRHTPPFIHEGLQQLTAKGVSLVVGIILSPQYSPYIMGGYHRALDEARDAIAPDLTVQVAGPWHTLHTFIDALASRVSQALETCTAAERNNLPVLMTAHSLPKVVADREPDYLATASRHRPRRRQTGWSVPQSVAVRLSERRPYTPRVASPRYQGTIPRPAPIRPLVKRSWSSPSNSSPTTLKVLYDIDIAAKQQAQEAGIELMRIQTPGVMPQMIETLAQVVHRHLRPPPQPHSR